MASTKRAGSASGRKSSKASSRRSQPKQARRTQTKRTRRRQPKQPSTQERLVQAVRSVKRPGMAAGAAAGVVGSVALAVRRRRSSGFDARGLAKRIGKTTKNLGKTSKQLGEEMQRLGDDAESVGKTLS